MQPQHQQKTPPKQAFAMDFIERQSAANNAWIEHGHHSMQRYKFAMNFVQGRVLDVACGTGYGSYVLGYRASHVLGVDIASTAIAEAKLHNSRHNVEYREGTLQQLTLPSNSFAAAVSLETLEHLSDPVTFLTEVARVLAPGGRLVISAPNALQYSRGAPPMHNPHHLNEPTFEQLSAWLDPYFRIEDASEHSPCWDPLTLSIGDLRQQLSEQRHARVYRR